MRASLGSCADYLSAIATEALRAPRGFDDAGYFRQIFRTLRFNAAAGAMPLLVIY